MLLLYRNRVKKTIQNLVTSSSLSSSSQTAGSNDVIGQVFFSSICAGTACLGVWQVNRYNWKVEVIRSVQENIRKQPVDCTSSSLDQLLVIAKKQGNEGRRLMLKGSFDHDNEVRVGPRAAPAGLMGSASQGMSVNPQGYYVITPFNLKSSNKDKTVVFVNRGWVGIKEKNWHKPKGEVILNTVISKAEKKNTFTPVNHSDNKTNTSKILIWIEASSILELSGVGSSSSAANPNEGDFILLEEVEQDSEPIVAKEGSSPYPVSRRHRHVTEQHVMPFTHLVYAVTWFSLTAFGLYLTRLRFRKNVTRKR